MGIILLTVLIQGIMVPAKDRGSFNLSLLTINSGIFQAIGVISFGKRLLRDPLSTTVPSQAFRASHFLLVPSHPLLMARDYDRV
jgi:hypothetical protein